MRMPILTITLLISVSTLARAQGTTSPSLSADEVVASMFARDTQREVLGAGYTGRRLYVLDNQRMHKRAEMVVSVNCDADGTKRFAVISEEGWKSAHKHVLRKMLESETETSRPETRPKVRMTPENYEFVMLGTELVGDRIAYVIEVLPKRHDRYLFRGRIWVDAEDYALARAEGNPAKNPSFWTRSVHFVQQYRRAGQFWFPLSTESVTEARIFGRTDVTISYFDYTAHSQTPKDFPSKAAVSGNEANHGES